MNSEDGFRGAPEGRRGGKRRAAHAKASQPRGGDKASPVVPAGPAYAADPWVDGPGPSRPGNQPSPSREDYPAWPGGEPGQHQDYYPAPPGGGAARREPPAAQYRGPRHQAASRPEPVLPRRRPAATPRTWDPGPASFPVQARQYGHPSGPMPQHGHPSGPMPQYRHPSGPIPEYSPPSGPMPQYGHPSGPIPEYSPPPPGPTPQYGHPSGPMPEYGAPPRMAAQFAAEGSADQLERLGREGGKLWTVDSVRLANQILSTASHQAAEITHEAQNQAAASLAGAKQEADALIRRAAETAEAAQAKLATAEQEAAELRATVAKLSAELGEVAAYVTKSLPSPTKPTASPAARPKAQAITEAAAPSPVKPAAKAAAKPGARSAGAQATKPGVSPRRIKPEPRSGGNPKNRQVNAMRKVMASFVILFLIGIATGATELMLHGGPFFIFRSNGSGASVTGPEEDQGPGQPNAPGAHHGADVTKAPAKPAKKLSHRERHNILMEGEGCRWLPQK